MKHLIFDTETTNLVHNSLQPLHKQPRIIEFFGLMLDDEKDFNEVGSLHCMINPGMPISAEVTRITGIKNEDVAGKPKFNAFIDEIEKIIGSADCIIAHNLSYDLSVTNFEFERLKRKLKWPTRRVCTVEATEHMKGFRLNLMALHTELFGEGFEKAHSAENDVRATARCYVELCKRDII